MADYDLVVSRNDDIAHGIRIEKLADQLPNQIARASHIAIEAVETLAELERLGDGDLFDGRDGHDAREELEEALRHLRNARRIAEMRASLIADEVAAS